MTRLLALTFVLLLTACPGATEFRESTGVLAVTPTGPVELHAELAMDGTDQPLQERIVIRNDGPGTVDVLSTRVLHLTGEQDWDIVQGYEAPLVRGDEVDLIVQYDAEFESDSEAVLNILIEGSFAYADWDEDVAEVLLIGTAVELD